MILVMGVSLFTSRIVLRELGVSDYGVYSLVGGFVSLFAFVNGAMSSATQRYLTYDIGKGDIQQLKMTFSVTLSIHIAIAVVVLFFAETIGLWYINEKMVFPVERHLAVNVVYQFSIAAALLGIIQVPYNALIIARERMSIYAYVSIGEVLLKLLIVFLLVFFGSDKLITYSVLTFVVALIIRLFYQFYCRRHYPESRFVFVKDKVYYRELVSYSSWNLIGNLAAVAKGQGNNLVLNLFFGTTVNAAYSVMNTVSGSVAAFIGNFQLASNPQIIKLYAGGDLESMQSLINKTAKFSFFLSLALMSPFLLNIDYILELWLVTPPPYSGILIKICLICSLVDSLSGPIIAAVTATGQIKFYHIVVGGLNLLNLPISYLLLKYSIFDNPQTILGVWLIISVISLFFRLLFLGKLTEFSVLVFVKDVLLSVSVVSVIVFIAHYFAFSKIVIDSFWKFLIVSVLSVFLSVVIVFFLGIKKNERDVLLLMKAKIFKRK